MQIDDGSQLKKRTNKAVTLRVFGMTAVLLIGIGFASTFGSRTITLDVLCTIPGIDSFEADAVVSLTEDKVFLSGGLDAGGAAVIVLDRSTGELDRWEDANAKQCRALPETDQVLVIEEDASVTIRSLNSDTLPIQVSLSAESKGLKMAYGQAVGEACIIGNFWHRNMGELGLVLIDLETGGLLDGVDLPRTSSHVFHRTPDGTTIASLRIPNVEESMSYRVLHPDSRLNRAFDRFDVETRPDGVRLLGFTANELPVYSKERVNYRNILLGDRAIKLPTILNIAHEKLVLGDYFIYDNKRGPSDGINVVDLRDGSSIKVHFNDMPNATHAMLHDIGAIDQLAISVGDAIYLLDLNRLDQ